MVEHAKVAIINGLWLGGNFDGRLVDSFPFSKLTLTNPIDESILVINTV